MRKTLFDKKDDSIWIKIVIYESKNGKLMVHGHDSGKIVQKIKDSYDYEYYISITAEEVEQLMRKLKLDDKHELFNWFEKEYSTDKAVSQIKAKLDELDIKYQFSTW